MVKVNSRYSRDKRVVMDAATLDPNCPQDMIYLNMHNEALARGDAEEAITILQIAENVTLRDSGRYLEAQAQQNKQPIEPITKDLAEKLLTALTGVSFDAKEYVKEDK